MGHLVQHRGGHVADRAVDVLGADVDFPVRLAIGLPDFVYGAPAIGSAPPIRRYRDGRAGQLARVELDKDCPRQFGGAAEGISRYFFRITTSSPMRSRVR